MIAGPIVESITGPRSFCQLPATSCGWIANSVRPGLVRLAGQEDEDDDRRDDRDVPPDADLVQERDEVDAGDVDGQLDEHQDAHRQQRAGEDRRVADPMRTVVLS